MPAKRSTPPEAFFAGAPVARAAWRAVRRRVAALGKAEVRVSRSQLAFHRARGFAYLWLPRRYLRGRAAPVVLSVVLGRRDLWSPAEIDGEVAAWLAEAWAHAA